MPFLLQPFIQTPCRSCILACCTESLLSRSPRWRVVLGAHLSRASRQIFPYVQRCFRSCRIHCCPGPPAVLAPPGSSSKTIVPGVRCKAGGSPFPSSHQSNLSWLLLADATRSAGASLQNRLQPMEWLHLFFLTACSAPTAFGPILSSWMR